MAEFVSTSISSGHYNDLVSSVQSAQQNRMTLDNISTIYNFENKIVFPMSFLRKYENILKSLSQSIILERRFWYKPEYLSYSLYGTTDLWYLILFLNEMKDPMEFCTPSINVPAENYIIEIIQKFKSIERDVNASHEKPIFLYRQLIKELTDPSEDVIKLDNSFIENPNKVWTPSNHDFSQNKFFETVYKLQMNSSTDPKDDTILASTNNVFPFLYYDMGDKAVQPISLPSNKNFISGESVHNGLIYSKQLKSGIDYVLLKRYNGVGVFSLKLNDNSIRSLNKKGDEVKFNYPLMTYDMREFSLLPEFIMDKMAVRIGDEIHRPVVGYCQDRVGLTVFIEENPINPPLETYVIDLSESEYYKNFIEKVVKVDREGKPLYFSDKRIAKTFKIYFNGAEYFIETPENWYSDDSTGIYRLEYIPDEDDEFINKARHSSETWILSRRKISNTNEYGTTFNYRDSTLEKDAYTFEEEFNNNFGGYVVGAHCITQSLNERNYMKFKIDLVKDLESNNIDIKKYAFLGFDLLYYLALDTFEHDNLEDFTKFAPLFIEMVTEEEDDEGNIIEKVYNYSLPYQLIFDDMAQSIDFEEENYAFYDTFNVSHIKRIIPIIKDLSSREVVKIKEIYISIKVDKINKTIDDDAFGIGIGGLKIYGFTYDDIIEEFNLPEGYPTNLYDFIYSYEYQKEYEGIYFEPYVFTKDTNLVEALSDDQVSLTETLDDGTVINKYSKYSKEENIIDITKDDNKFYIESTMNFGNSVYYSDYYLIDYRLLGEDDFVKSDFNLENNYQLELLIELLDNEESINSLNKTCFGILTNIQNVNHSYMINFGEKDVLSRYTSRSTFSINTSSPENDLTKTFSLMPDGLVKQHTIGSEHINIFRNMEDLAFNFYPIFQRNLFNSKLGTDDSSEKQIYIIIERKEKNLIVKYKFRPEDNYLAFYSIIDFFEIYNNGTFGFRVYNNIPIRFNILNYNIEKQ